MNFPIEHLPSPNQRLRPAGTPIDMLILHYTGMQSATEAIARLRDPEAAVSSHYVVDEDGRVACLVEEDRRAAHAGISYWRGHEALNDRSIGIEIVNPGHQWGYRSFPEAQIRAVEALCAGILDRYRIPPCNVVGHSDVAPDRKQDPGELFPWRRLAQRGIGIPPSDFAGNLDAASVGDELVGRVRLGLRGIGYRIATTGARDDNLAVVLTAFQRHWRQELVNGIADRGTLCAIETISGEWSDPDTGSPISRRL